jgi:hypothetical protein
VVPDSICVRCGGIYETPAATHILRTTTRETLPGGASEYVILAETASGTSLLHMCEISGESANRIAAAQRIVTQQTRRSPDEALRFMEELALVSDATLEEVAHAVIEGTITLDNI